MTTPLQLRYVPLWLSNVFRHYDCDVNSFENIVSKHDLKLYKLANHLVRTKLLTLGVEMDVTFPDGDMTEGYTVADATFALFGQNPEGKQVSDFSLTYFDVMSDNNDVTGVWFVETSPKAGDEKLIYSELLSQIALHLGKEIAFQSSSFKRYLGIVKNNSEGAVV